MVATSILNCRPFEFLIQVEGPDHTGQGFVFVAVPRAPIIVVSLCLIMRPPPNDMS